MKRQFYTVAAIQLAILAALFGILAATAHAKTLTTDTPAQAVALSDATTAPTYMTLLRPGASALYTGRGGYNCPGGSYFTDVSAYTWQGRALGPQRWTRDHTLTYWRVPNHPRQFVTFDGIKFHNDSHRAVLVAGWCD